MHFFFWIEGFITVGYCLTRGEQFHSKALISAIRYCSPRRSRFSGDPARCIFDLKSFSTISLCELNQALFTRAGCPLNFFVALACIGQEQYLRSPKFSGCVYLSKAWLPDTFSLVVAISRHRWGFSHNDTFSALVFPIINLALRRTGIHNPKPCIDQPRIIFCLPSTHAALERGGLTLNHLKLLHLQTHL